MAIILLTPAQCKMARTVLRLNTFDLGQISQVSRTSIVRFENYEADLKVPLRLAIQYALEQQGCVFIENGGVIPPPEAELRKLVIAETYGGPEPTAAQRRAAARSIAAKENATRASQWISAPVEVEANPPAKPPTKPRGRPRKVR